MRKHQPLRVSLSPGAAFLWLRFQGVHNRQYLMVTGHLGSDFGSSVHVVGPRRPLGCELGPAPAVPCGVSPPGTGDTGTRASLAPLMLTHTMLPATLRSLERAVLFYFTFLSLFAGPPSSAPSVVAGKGIGVMSREPVRAARAWEGDVGAGEAGRGGGSVSLFILHRAVVCVELCLTPGLGSEVHIVSFVVILSLEILFFHCPQVHTIMFI